MSDNASRHGAVDLGVPLMILAFVVIGWFLYWLNEEAAAERALGVIEDTTVTATDLSSATTISAADIQLDASPFEGQLIRLAGLDVASRLGAQGFWLTLPNRNPFLVSLSDEVVAEGVSVSSGQTVSVIGTVISMNDSIATSWTAAGTINEGERLAAAYATHFIEAARVEITGGGGPGAAPGN